MNRLIAQATSGQAVTAMVGLVCFLCLWADIPVHADDENYCQAYGGGQGWSWAVVDNKDVTGDGIKDQTISFIHYAMGQLTALSDHSRCMYYKASNSVDVWGTGTFSGSSSNGLSLDHAPVVVLIELRPYRSATVLTPAAFFYIYGDTNRNGVVDPGEPLYWNFPKGFPSTTFIHFAESSSNGYLPWAQSLFGSNVTSPECQPSGDYDHDGMDNLMEYALGTDAAAGNQNPISVGFAGDHFAITFPARTNLDSGITYIVETATNLMNWTSNVVQVDANPGADGFQVVTWQCNQNASDSSRQFIRLRVALN